MRYRCLNNDTVVLTFSIWTSLAAPVWLTVRRTVCSQSGHRFHENTPSIEHAIAWWHWQCHQWFPAMIPCGKWCHSSIRVFSTVPHCEPGSGRRAAGAHSKLDSQPGLSPGYLAATRMVQWNQEYCETRIPLFPWVDALGPCLAEMNDITDSASVSREFFILVISSLWVHVFKRAYLCNCTAVFPKNFSFYLELA